MVPGLEGTVLANPLIFAGFLAWVLFWKGWALWLSARRNERVWFIALLIVNTIGILDIIYILFIAKRKDVREPRP